MKSLTLLAILALLAAPAFAGDGEGCPGGCPLGSDSFQRAGALDGYVCENMCPLAKQANQCRSCGEEAAVVSVRMREDVTATVERNLAKI